MHQSHEPMSAAAEVGLRLRTRRLELDLTPAQVAEGLGVTVERIQELESGLANLKVPELVRLCPTLKVKPMWIFEGLVERPPRLRLPAEQQGLTLKFPTPA